MIGRSSRESGFTLLESLIALSILAAVVMHFLGLRTAALIDAAEARNWRVARDIAATKISELEAGANEFPPDNRQEVDVEEVPDFTYMVVIGEQAISELESTQAEERDDFARSDSDSRYAERTAWDQERQRVRRAQAQGMTMSEYDDHLLEEELEDKAPSESEYEDVAVIVYFPNVRPSDEDARARSSFTLKAKISTMALQGLTPDEAQQIALRKGQEFASTHRPPGAPIPQTDDSSGGASGTQPGGGR